MGWEWRWGGDGGGVGVERRNVSRLYFIGVDGLY